MKCPYCKSELIEGEYKEFETLCDHVCDPNAESYPLRITYVCSGKCKQSNNRFWDDYGDMYGEFPTREEYATKMVHEAIDSRSREFKMKLQAEREERKNKYILS